MHHRMIHLFGAYYFFCTLAVGTTINTYLSYVLSRVGSQSAEVEKAPHYTEAGSERRPSIERQVFTYQMYTVVVFWIAVMVYIPIGTMIKCPVTPISVEEVRVVYIIWNVLSILTNMTYDSV